MALSDFNGWSNLCMMIIFAVLGGLFMYWSRPSVQQPTSWTKTYKGAGIFFLICAGVNFVLVVMHAGAAYYAENVPASMDAVIPVGENPVVVNDNTYYSASDGNNNAVVRNGNVYSNANNKLMPQRGALLLQEGAPGPTRANLLKQTARIPNTPVGA